MIGLGLYRVLTIGLGTCENLLFSGILFGWASLVYILKQEGYFSHLCIPTNTTFNNSFSQVSESSLSNFSTQKPVRQSYFMQEDNMSSSRGDVEVFLTCPEQDAELQLVFTIATFCYEILLFPMGMLLDKLGTFAMRLLSSCLIVTGLLLIAFSSMDTPYLLFPASSFLAVGGVELMFTNMQISNLFGRRKSTVMTFLSGCLDSSPFVFIIVKLGYENFGIPLQTSFCALAGTCLIMCFNSILLPKTGHIPYPLPPGYRQEKPMAERGMGRKRADMDDQIEMERMHEQSDEELDSSTEVEEATSSQSTTEALKIIRYPSLQSCIISLPALCLLFWFALLQLNMFFFLGTINPALERLADNDQTIVSTYTTALAICQACSIFLAPVCGILLDRNRTKKTMSGTKRGPYDDLLDSRMVFAFTSFLYIAFNVTLIINVIELRYASFVLHVISRSFMYSLVVTGCALFFPVKYFGSTTGLVESSASLIGLLQRPMYAIQQNYLNNDSFWLYIWLIVLNVMTLLLPIYIHYYVKRESRLKGQRESGGQDHNAGVLKRYDI